MSGQGGIITTAVRHLMAAGVTGEALLAAIAEIERTSLQSVIFRTLMDAMRGAGCDDDRINAAFIDVAKAMERRPVVRRAPEVVYPAGAKERWGYDGHETPRLPDREWWPLRNAVIEEAGSTCHYCGDQHSNMCADHVVPLSRGGTNERDNLVCCCLPCNSSKNDKLLSEWPGRYR